MSKENLLNDYAEWKAINEDLTILIARVNKYNGLSLANTIVKNLQLQQTRCHEHIKDS